MPDRDRVVPRLQIIRTWAEVGKTSDGIQGAGCLQDVVNWIDDALELLKEQEPRVLSTSEIIMTGDVITCYLEVKGQKALYGAYLQNYDADHTQLSCDVGNATVLLAYGKARLWSAKPTDEQREGTPWTE